jgi:hypothetical protein
VQGKIDRWWWRRWWKCARLRCFLLFGAWWERGIGVGNGKVKKCTYYPWWPPFQWVQSPRSLIVFASSDEHNNNKNDNNIAASCSLTTNISVLPPTPPPYLPVLLILDRLFHPFTHPSPCEAPDVSSDPSTAHLHAGSTTIPTSPASTSSSPREHRRGQDAMWQVVLQSVRQAPLSALPSSPSPPPPLTIPTYQKNSSAANCRETWLSHHCIPPCTKSRLFQPPRLQVNPTTNLLLRR